MTVLGAIARSGGLCLFLGACAIALAPILVRFSDVSAIATGFYRMGFAGVALLGPWLLLERSAKPESAGSSGTRWLLMLAAGTCFAVDVMFFHAASRMTTVANATLLLNFAPIFVVLGVWILFGERPRPALVAGLVLALAGATLLMSHSLSLSAEHLRGDMFGLAAAIFYAGYLVAVSRLRLACSTLEIMIWTSLVGAAVLAPPALLSDDPFLSASAEGWAILIALGVLSHAGGQSLIAYALALLPVGFSGVALLVQPVAAAVFAWLLLGETLGPVQSVGGAIVIAGVLIARQSAVSKPLQPIAPSSR